MFGIRNQKAARINCNAAVKQVYPNAQLLCDRREGQQYLSIWVFDNAMLEANSENIFDPHESLYVHEYRHI